MLTRVTSLSVSVNEPTEKNKTVSEIKMSYHKEVWDCGGKTQRILEFSIRQRL